MSEAFRTLAGGFKLVYAGLVIVVLAAIINSVGSQIVAQQMGFGQPGGPPIPKLGDPPQGPLLVMAVVVGLLTLLGSLVGLVGMLRCRAVPDEVPGAKGLITSAIVFQVISLIGSAVGTVTQAVGVALPMEVMVVVGSIGGVLGFVAGLLFMRFIRAVAAFIRRADLSKRAKTVLVLYAVVGVLLAVVGGLFLFAMQSEAIPGLPGGPQPGEKPTQEQMSKLMVFGLGMCGAGCGMLVCGLAFLVLYARLLTGMIAACKRYADDPTRPTDEPADDYDDRDRDDRR